MPPSIVLVLAIIAISFAAPLVRLSTAHPLAIAIWRLGFALIVIAGVLLVTGSWRQWRRLDRSSMLVAIAAGVMLSLHFWSWNASVALTTVSASVVLVNVQSVLVTGLSVLWLHETPTPRQWLGIGIAMIGAVVVAAPDVRDLFALGMTTNGMRGDVLALLGAATAALYVVCGRRLRTLLDVWPYVALVYGTCFVILIGLAAAVDAPVLHQPPREIAIFAGLAIGPMLLGHTGINWALGYLRSYIVSLTLLTEPIGATILAALLPSIHETPGLCTLAGGALVLAGIWVATTRLRVSALRSSDAGAVRDEMAPP